LGFRKNLKHWDLGIILGYRKRATPPPFQYRWDSGNYLLGFRKKGASNYRLALGFRN
jgi:hypothetical protein